MAMKVRRCVVRLSISTPATLARTTKKSNTFQLSCMAAEGGRCVGGARSLTGCVQGVCKVCVGGGGEVYNVCMDVEVSEWVSERVGV